MSKTERIAELEARFDELAGDYADLEENSEKQEAAIAELAYDNSGLDNELDRAQEIVRGAISDLRTLGEVPLGLLDDALLNIIADLRKILP